MAKKKEPSIADAVSGFQDIINRSGFKEFIMMDGKLYSINPKGVQSFIIIDKTLWSVLSEDETFLQHIKELDVTNPENDLLKEKFGYIDMDVEGWVSIDETSMYNGEIINITLNGFNYSASINKTMFPLRLKKAEFNNFAYRIFKSPRFTLVIRKKFEGPVPDTSFTIARLFQII